MYHVVQWPKRHIENRPKVRRNEENRDKYAWFKIRPQFFCLSYLFSTSWTARLISWM